MGGRGESHLDSYHTPMSVLLPTLLAALQLTCSPRLCFGTLALSHWSCSTGLVYLSCSNTCEMH